MPTLSPTALRLFFAGALACAAGCGGDESALPDSADAPSWGDEADYMHEDGGAGADGAAPQTPGDGDAVHLRLLHALPNVDALVVCHDPDLRVDALDTPDDDSANGPESPVELPISAGFGDEPDYVDISPKARGALTFHRRIDPPAESDAGAPDDPGSDAGPGDGDASGDGDGDGSGGADASAPIPVDGGGVSLDAGTDLPDYWPAPRDACDPRTLEAVMPLPFTGSWLDPSAPVDLSLAGISPTLDKGEQVTLLASGYALDEQRLAAEASLARTAYLQAHAGDELGASRAALAARNALLAAHGPRVVPVPTPGLSSGEPRLAFAHLVPDVPSSTGTSGALKLCIKMDDVEQRALPAEGPGFAFRMRAVMDTPFVAAKSLTFRAFVAENFDAEAKDCASTSLAPVAERTILASDLKAGKTYTLVALGAVDPDALCSPSRDDALSRGACSGSTTLLGVRLMLLAD